MGELCIMGAAGDESVEWDPSDEASTSKARETFDRLKAAGYKAYEAVSTRGREITEFKPDLGKLIMAPAGAPAMSGGPLASEPQAW